MESDSRIDTLREALVRLVERGIGLDTGDYVIRNKRETGRNPLPSEADYTLALSREPLEGDDALSNSWPNILRRLRVTLLEWWQAWDDSVVSLKALPKEADYALSRAFNDQWRLRLSRALVEVGGAVGSTRPPETEWTGRLDLSAFVFSRLPTDWRALIDQLTKFADELLAAQNVREERENREVSPPGDLDQLLSHQKIADRLGIPADDAKGREALRKRLESWRRVNFDGGWVEVKDAKPREPRYLYYLGKVLSDIPELKTSG